MVPFQWVDIESVLAAALLLIALNVLASDSRRHAAPRGHGGGGAGAGLHRLAARLPGRRPRDRRHGKAVLLLIATVAVSDTAQFYTGRTLGRTPLAPLRSPKKTREGALGGFVDRAALPRASPGRTGCRCSRGVGTPALGLGIVVAGIIGDLFESMLKRAADMKDSGTLIPGHGGVLDRIDALLFAAPVFYFFLAQRLVSGPLGHERAIAILGSTGSIGTSALDVARTHRDRVEVVAIAAATNVAAMVKQILEFRPRAVAMATGEAMDKLRAALGGSPAEISGVGNEGLCEIATHPDVDIVLVRLVRHGGARCGAVRDRGGQDHRAREQGSARHGGRHRHGRGAHAKAWRSCPSTASTTRSISACTAAPQASCGG